MKMLPAWCLEKIQLPSGGKINVQYEADDYAYVQDRKAMQMIKVIGSSNVANVNPHTLSNYLYKAKKGGNQDYLYFKLPTSAITKEELIHKYFKDENGENINHMYYSFFVNMNRNTAKSKADPYEYIKGYAQLDYSEIGVCSSDNNYAYIKLKAHHAKKKRNNPISVAAWQMGLLNLRHVMIRGSNSQYEENEGKGAILGLLNSIPQALNLFVGPYQYLRWKRVAYKFDPAKSWIRLFNPNGIKNGGGSRVKTITINDNWSDMDSDQTSTEYGQEFIYTDNGQVYGNSSGVASYEPSIGGDENPFRRPVYYKENVALGPTNTKFQEEPFGESFFPGASVGYSKVTVRNIAKNYVHATATGRTENEFYTAKDFPVHMKRTGVDRNDNSTNLGKFVKQLFSPIIRDYEAASQGYLIELNDMHGKPKSVKVFGEKGGEIDLISGTEYRYKSDGKRLKNEVDVLTESGDIESHDIGKEYDIALDTRKSRSVFVNGGVDWNGETLFLGIPIPAIIPIPRYKQNETMYQSAVMTKVIQRYGILEETIAYDYGSQVSTKNLLWDEQTGQVLLTSTKNEYEDDIYNFSYPAHLAYEGMGPSYKNIGYEKEITLSVSGKHLYNGTEGNTENYFTAGDELLLVGIGAEEDKKGWVLKSDDDEVLVIDRYGQAISGNYKAKIIRSGRRNLSSVSVGSIVSMHNPLSNASSGLELEEDIIQTAALNYSEEWQGYCGRAFIGEHEVCDTFDLAYLSFLILKEHIRVNGYQGVVNAELRTDIDIIFQHHEAIKDINMLYDLSSYLENEAGFADIIRRMIKNQYSERESLNFGLVNYDSIFLGSEDGTIINKVYVKYGSNDSFLSLDFCPNLLQIDFVNSCSYLVSSIDSIGSSYTIDGSFNKMMSYSGNDSCEVQSSGSCELIDCYTTENCYYTLGEILNPYVNGMRGIWRPKKTYAFVSERKYKHKKDTTDIRYDGIIKGYSPYWTFKPYTNETGLEAKPVNHDNWVASTEATIYTPEGNGVEEKNALGIYSSQLFGYGNNLVTAVAANARNRQIAFDNFEDYSFPYRGCRDDDHWDFRKDLVEDGVELYSSIFGPNTHIDHFGTNTATTHAYIVKDTAHSGLYSLAINPGEEQGVTRRIDFSDLDAVGESSELFRVDDYSKCISLFAPDTGTQYVISAWMKENIVDLNSINSYENGEVKVTLYEDNVEVDSFIISTSGVIIEGWQRMEGKFKIPFGVDEIKVTLVNPSEHKIYFDDIRIHPYHSNMKSYVYHPVHLKIMAELDENNFASFYEYDEEGSLIRMKKETVNGIVTLQETRKSIRKD